MELHLYMQMLPYGGNTSQETDAHTHTQRYGDQEMEHLVYRQEVQEEAEYHKSVRHIVQCVIIQRIDQSQRYRRTDQTDQHTLQHERCTHEEVRGSDVFHNVDFFRPDGNTDGYGIADQEDADCVFLNFVPNTVFSCKGKVPYTVQHFTVNRK